MRSLLIVTLTALSLLTGAQTFWDNEEYRPISTAADYLLMAPDARSTGLGLVGVASSPDVFSMHWNPAKYAFLDDRFGIAVSFSDYLWMKEMWKWNDDVNLKIGFNTLHSFFKPNERSALALSFTYYDPFGEVTYTDEYGNAIGSGNGFDINLDLAYSYKISDNFSAAIASRYIYSSFTAAQFVQGAEKWIAQSVAFDLAVYYQKSLELGSKEAELRWGVDISNIGKKMSYVKDDDYKNFLPTNLRLGSGLTYHFNENHSISFQFDANKLLVPSQPVYQRDSMGYPVYDDDGNPVIAEGKDPNVPVCKGMIQSWYDAPGGFEEEMREWAVGSGFEYRYKTFFSARSGLFYESETKGHRQYLTAGAGFKVGLFGMDFGLLIPLEHKMRDSYISIFYFRTSIAIGLQGKP